jgi:hypothetical protein
LRRANKGSGVDDGGLNEHAQRSRQHQRPSYQRIRRQHCGLILKQTADRAKDSTQGVRTNEGVITSNENTRKPTRTSVARFKEQSPGSWERASGFYSRYDKPTVYLCNPLAGLLLGLRGTCIAPSQRPRGRLHIFSRVIGADPSVALWNTEAVFV